MFNRKKSLLIGSVGIIFIAVTLVYYMIPIKADKIFPRNEMDNIIKIHFGDYKYGDMKTYEVEFDKPKKVKQILEILNYSKYKRDLGHENIRNDGKFLSMYLFEKDLKSHILDINDQGYLKFDKKTYKITKNQSKIFNELYEILVSNRKPVN